MSLLFHNKVLCLIPRISKFNSIKYLLSINSYKYEVNKQMATLAETEVQKTVLYDYHVSNKGKMVNFAGYYMPVQYGDVGISRSHNHVRKYAGLFDVSHMLQTKFFGKDKIKFMETLIVGDIVNLKPNTSSLSLLTTKTGGIIDDLICSKVFDNNKDYLYVVSNAGCRGKDLSHIKSHLKEFQSKGYSVELEIIEDHGLVALQGPLAHEILQKLTPLDLSKLYFMNTIETDICGTKCRVTRCGYTGEDGFELSIPNNKIQSICDTIIKGSNGVAQLAGLGSRDSLRLEAGLCLYGNDITEETTPIEANLTWTIGKRRREEKDFFGSEVILKQLITKPDRKRIGLVSKGIPMRSGCKVLADDKEIGQITSGCPSPTIGKNIAMAYVPLKFSKIDTELTVKIRNQTVNAVVSKMPFVKCNYYLPPK